jgi:septal ring factor EnvC (AmiA/AmiB activator)
MPARRLIVRARGSQRVLATVALVAATALPPFADSAPAQTSDDVAAEIVRVQVAADRTAEAWREADFQAEELEIELAAAEQRVAEAEAVETQMRETLGEIAVRRFMESASTGPAVFFTSDPMAPLERDTLRAYAAQEGSLDLDEYGDVRRDLIERREEVAALQAQVEEAKAELERQSRQLDQDLADLERLRVRLKDAEVRAAYEAQIAAIRKAQQEAEAKAAAERAAAEREAAAQSEREAAEAAAAQEAAARGSGVGVAAGDGASEPVGQVFGFAGWVCPVAGPTAFGDTWGAARSGGRRHKGVDMMSPGGTPLVAVVSGLARMKHDGLGGRVVSLLGDDGTRYYYAHLSDWEGPTRPVQAGEVVGYVGRTGNTSTNHLHFEIHPGGGAAVNPYPTVRQHC